MKHAINWFEIPSSDFDRAVAFYGTILDAELRRELFNGTPNAIFPYENDGDKSVGGALVHAPNMKPSKDGVLPYLNVNGKLDQVLSRVEAAGGKVLLPKTDIGMGCIALIADSEGNRVGLHSY